MSEAEASTETASKIKSVAETYLEAIESEVDDEHRHTLTAKRGELQQRVERYKEEYGAESSLTKRAQTALQNVEAELDDHVESEERVSNLREQLLNTTATHFAFTPDWLESPVIEALNHALLGERATHLNIDGVRVEKASDLDDVDQLNQFDMEETLLQLVNDRRGTTDAVETVWERFQDSSYYAPFCIVVRQGTATPDDVVTVLDEDLDRKTVKNRLERPMYDWETLVPYYRVGDGAFGLTTAGQYFAYWYLTPDDVAEESETTKDQSDEPTADGTSGSDGEAQLSITELNPDEEDSHE